MEHDTITLARHATAMERPEPTVMIRQSDEGALATAQEVPADRKPGDGDGAAKRRDPAQVPELERLGDQIAEMSARIDAATCELLCQLREFDHRHGWEGWRSCAHWLNWRTGLDLGAAREKLRVAAALADLNHIAAAMARGQLSYSKVRALTRVATPATEARLLAVALGATASQVERLVRAWRRADGDAAPDAEQERLASRALSMQVDDDGMVVLRGRLPAEVGAVLLRAVEAALEQVPASAGGGESTIAQRRADALGLVAESALAGGLDPGNSADRFQVTVHVQADTLATREAAGEARRVSAETRSAGPAATNPAAAAAGAPPHVAAETRSAGLAASKQLTAVAGAPHVAAETQSAGSAVPEPPTAVADMPHVAAETWTAGPEASERPSTATVAAAHGAAEPLEHGARPDASAVPSTASAVGRPLGDMRSRNGRDRVTAGASPLRDQSARSRRDSKLNKGRCAGSAAWSPRRDESARCSGGAKDPSTRPVTVSEIASEWASPDADLDAGLAVIEQVGGLHLGREAARRVACDAGLVVLSHGADGEVLDVGRRTRTVPSALRRALQSRDRNQCQFPGCDSRRCDAHHVEHWADGGEMRLPNLVSLCRFHHRAVHEQGFRVVPGDTDGRFRFLRPEGEPVPAEPPVASWAGTPLAPTDARLAAAGTSIGPDTATPEWYGESLDLTAALDVLWEPPATAARGSS